MLFFIVCRMGAVPLFVEGKVQPDFSLLVYAIAVGYCSSHWLCSMHSQHALITSTYAIAVLVQLEAVYVIMGLMSTEVQPLQCDCN